MANWVTLKNGVHIDLDDPNNPLTGDGSFSDLGKGGSDSKSGGKSSSSLTDTSKMTKSERETKGNAVKKGVTSDDIFDVMDQFDTVGYAVTDNKNLAELYNMNLNPTVKYTVTEMADGKYRIDSNIAGKGSGKSRHEKGSSTKGIDGIPKNQSTLDAQVSDWLSNNTDKIHYVQGPGGRGVTAAEQNNLAKQFLKETFGYKEDSYTFDYDTGLDMSRAMSAAFQNTWRQRNKK